MIAHWLQCRQCAVGIAVDHKQSYLVAVFKCGFSSSRYRCTDVNRYSHCRLGRFGRIRHVRLATFTTCRTSRQQNTDNSYI